MHALKNRTSKQSLKIGLKSSKKDPFPKNILPRKIRSQKIKVHKKN